MAETPHAVVAYVLQNLPGSTAEEVARGLSRALGETATVAEVRAIARKHRDDTPIHARMHPTWEQVKEMRRLYLAGMTIRDIESLYDYHAADAVVRNHIHYDPDYQPPDDRRSSRHKALTLLGTRMTVADWARDPRCQVSAETLRRRVRAGHPEDPSILRKDDPRGRKPKPRG